MAVTAVVELSGATRERQACPPNLEHHDVVLRYQGGSNAGHTSKSTAQRSNSSCSQRILRSGKHCLLCDGVVVTR